MYSIGFLGPRLVPRETVRAAMHRCALMCSSTPPEAALHGLWPGHMDSRFLAARSAHPGERHCTVRSKHILPALPHVWGERGFAFSPTESLHFCIIHILPALPCTIATLQYLAAAATTVHVQTLPAVILGLRGVHPSCASGRAAS